VYVAFVPSDEIARQALETHASQEHQGSDPANKSFTAGATGGGSVSGLVPLTTQRAKPDAPYVAGLMVRAADTGRVLMLQRSLDDDQQHAAGKLEPPGGHVESGETLAQGALREFSEETGMSAPRGTLSGSWTSSDGVYRGFVLDVPSEDVLDLENGRSEHTNPDGDSFEVVLWVDPGDFAGNPLVRPEMARDLAQVRAALGGAMKSAQTPVVSTVHHPLGHEGLWHTPSKKVPEMQQLPAYHQNTARALMRDQGMGESQAIATAVNAIREWKQGRAFGGRVKVTPQVQAAAARADAEFEALRAAHH
jgi:8-oxo-dGTP pyrophosphatase MutT (NUDIX family)